MRDKVRKPELEVLRSAAPATAPAPATDGLLQLQRLAGNAATVATLHRKIAKPDSLPPDQGPIAEIADSALSGDAKAAADEAVGYIKAGTPKAQHAWAIKAKAEGKGKLVKGFKWGVNHKNFDGHLPGVKGAGGYKEYYLRTKAGEDSEFDGTGRLCVSNSTGDIFHSNTHYGEAGSPAFTHYGKL